MILNSKLSAFECKDSGGVVKLIFDIFTSRLLHASHRKYGYFLEFTNIPQDEGRSQGRKGENYPPETEKNC